MSLLHKRKQDYLRRRRLWPSRRRAAKAESAGYAAIFEEAVTQGTSAGWETESDLLCRCKAGEEGAREELCRRYRPAALRMAYSITGGGDEVEDLVQEAFCRLFAHLRRLRGEAAVTTWLYRTLVNLQHDRARRQCKKRELPLETLPENAGYTSLVAQDPAEEVEKRLLRQRFVVVVKKLSRRDRKMLWLRFRREYSHAQIAKHQNCTVDAVKCRLYRITRYLRQELAFD